MGVATDRWRDRLQLQIGLRFDLMPSKHDTWWQWAFSPTCGLTRVGQVLENGRVRQQLPDTFGRGYVDMIDHEKDPITGLRQTTMISRCFWLHGAIRILGFDLGAGIFYRKRFTP